MIKMCYANKAAEKSGGSVFMTKYVVRGRALLHEIQELHRDLTTLGMPSHSVVKSRPRAKWETFCLEIHAIDGLGEVLGRALELAQRDRLRYGSLRVRPLVIEPSNSAIGLLQPCAAG